MNNITTYDKPREECGVIGIYSKDIKKDILKTLNYALYSLQHRGQESAGITISNYKHLFTYKAMGLVSDLFTSNIPKDTEQHSNYSDGEWKVYRIKEIGKRLNDSGLTDKWQNYTYLYPEVYLTKEAAENHKPSDLHCDTAHATYEIIEQTVINK